MGILTLLTDFGTQDGFIGVMKGVIWGICPDVKIADLSHQIEPQNVLQGAITLSRVAPFFPEGTVHVAVVDPGVGTKRRAIAAQLGMQRYVAPDNGLLTPLIQAAEEKHLPMTFVDLDNPDYWLKSITGTFHGRDLFAPVGAHLAAGVPLEELGTPIGNPTLLGLSTPEKTDTGWLAHITLIDHFGNIRTDLRTEQIEGDPIIRILGHEIKGLVKSYGHREVGTLVALSDSGGYLEVAVVNGSAAKKVGAKVGDVVEVYI
ncbi:MAG: SAM-dependent chlorinase/fluorinase [Anaerolineae bacterium]|jgi:S-adenosyl-L-methionine hydrolase (adenosine-forming)|nr:SAM-dependent chlorinase/fluorinase [Anaerolineae bacterium]MBT7072783.1 SAM-dependent chlorinase/fluorinase [Anaerolineae bacterium]MBT7323786.1 SAM-dependent chlorinase/fluorinase [Anaerolineae bacterium]